MMVALAAVVFAVLLEPIVDAFAPVSYYVLGAGVIGCLLLML